MSGSCGVRWREFSFDNGGVWSWLYGHKSQVLTSFTQIRTRKGVPCPPCTWESHCLHLHRVEMSCCNWRHYSSFARQYSDSDSQLFVNRVGHGWFHSLISDCCCCSASKSCPALWPRGLQHCRLPCPSSVMDNHSSRLVKAPSLWFSFIDKSTHSELPKRAAAITKVLALATMLFSDHIVSDASPDNLHYPCLCFDL